MSHNSTSRCESRVPVRARRRLSDAKWRASVATCYDALKFVVPNMKSLSKRKISKTLILQESEKHITELESVINYLLTVECPSKGRAVLWEENDSWSHCSIEKLQADFCAQQRKVFHSSSNGRRCYSLFHDIKEEVLNIRVDPNRLAFISSTEDKLEMPKTVLVTRHIPLPDHEQMSKKRICEETTSKLEQKNKESGTADGRKRKAFPRYPPTCVAKKEKIQIRQQPRLKCSYFQSEDENKAATASAFLQEAMSVRKAVSTEALTTSSEQRQHACDAHEELPQTVPSISDFLMSPNKLSTVKVKDEKRVHECGKTDISSQFGADGIEDCVDGRILSSLLSLQDVDYTHLMEELEREKAQEVPCLKTPKEKGRKRCNSHSKERDIFLSGSRGNLSEKKLSGNSSVPFSKKAQCYSQSKCKDKCLSATSIFNSLTESASSCVKMEVDELSTPKLSSTPSVVKQEMGSTSGQTSLQSSARKKLNFNIPTCSGTPQTISRFLSPVRVPRPSPMISGFTPVKLPPDLMLTADSDGVVDTFNSPWKEMDSSRIVPQGYMDKDSMIDLNDGLLCLETMDSMDLDDSFQKQETPGDGPAEKKLQPADTWKRRISPKFQESPKVQPKCRRSLEKYYSELAHARRQVHHEDSQVVPQMDTAVPQPKEENSCTGTTPVIKSHLSPGVAVPNSSLSPTGYSDFDGFLFYYQQVGQQLKQKLGSQDLQSPTVATKVAQMWACLPHQDKVTMATLASLEGQSANVGLLSHDLEELDVKPLDPHEFFPSQLM